MMMFLCYIILSIGFQQIYSYSVYPNDVDITIYPDNSLRTCFRLEFPDHYNLTTQIRCFGYQLGFYSTIVDGEDFEPTEYIGDEPDEMGTNLKPIDFYLPYDEILDVALGDAVVCALLKEKGTGLNKAMCIGNGQKGARGSGDKLSCGYTGPFGTPVDPDSVKPVEFNYSLDNQLVEIVYGTDHGCGRFESHQIICWGWEVYKGTLGVELDAGQYSLGDEPGELGKFIDLGPIKPIRQIAASYATNYVLYEDGTVVGFGNDVVSSEGFVAVGTNVTAVDFGTNPVGTKISKLALQTRTLCVLYDDKRTVRCKGRNPMLSPDNFEYVKLVQLDFENDLDIIDISHTFGYCFQFEDFTVRCMAIAFYDYFLEHDLFLDFGATIQQVGLGASTTCALLENNVVRCFGVNDYTSIVGIGTRTPIEPENLRENVDALKNAPAIDLGICPPGTIENYSLTEGLRCNCADNTQYGAGCLPVECVAFGGVCNEGTCWGAKGTGRCSTCTNKFFGDLCLDATTCSIVTGICNEGDCFGVTGNGECSACTTGHFGPNCVSTVTCNEKHGVCLEGSCFGPRGTGECTVCSQNFFGPNCEQEVVCDKDRGTCEEGTCSGVAGNGKCSSCNEGYVGEDCEPCVGDACITNSGGSLSSTSSFSGLMMLWSTFLVMQIN